MNPVAPKAFQHNLSFGQLRVFFFSFFSLKRGNFTFCKIDFEEFEFRFFLLSNPVILHQPTFSFLSFFFFFLFFEGLIF